MSLTGFRPVPVRYHFIRTLGTRSPAHLFGGYDKINAALEQGQAVHSIMLGGDGESGLRVVAYTGGPRTGKKFEEFATANADALILTPTEYAKVTGMVASLRAHPLACRALDGQREQRIEWEMDGVRCRGTPDVHTADFVTELKTGRTAAIDEYLGFPRHAQRMHYPAQLGWYGEGLERAKKIRPRFYYIVAVEDEAPFVVTVFKLTERALEAGNKTWRGWFERFKVCLENNHWPAYAPSDGAAIEIDVPEEMPALIFGDEDEPAADAA